MGADEVCTVCEMEVSRRAPFTHYIQIIFHEIVVKTLTEHSTDVSGLACRVVCKLNGSFAASPPGSEQKEAQFPFPDDAS